MSYSIGNESFSRGVVTTSYSSNLSRTATTQAYLFTLPAHPVIKSMAIIGPKSNAGTSARISIGSNGDADTILAQFNVKTNGEVSYPSSFDATPGSAWDNEPFQVFGTYAEDGSSSDTGGPWTIIVDVLGTE